MSHHRHHHAASHPTVLTVRALSGLSGDMMLTGLARMAQVSNLELTEMVESLALPVAARVEIVPREVQGILGWGAVVDIPHEHSHRTFADIRTLIAASGMPPEAKETATAAFAFLAEAEGKVHGKPADSVCFHEVGALDSILDICLVCALFHRLNPGRFVCSPLPVGDGSVHCAHGWLPTPAPAVLELLAGLPVCGFPACGETLTPTALTLLKTLGADFGPWPDMIVEQRALVYGGKVFPNAPNGIIWAMGTATTHQI